MTEIAQIREIHIGKPQQYGASKPARLLYIHVFVGEHDERGVGHVEANV